MPESLELIRRDCAASQVRSYARRYQAKPGLGWPMGMFLLMILGSVVIWSLIICAVLRSVGLL